MSTPVKPSAAAVLWSRSQSVPAFDKRAAIVDDRRDRAAPVTDLARLPSQVLIDLSKLLQSVQ